jgi:hypothetical protein
MPGRIRLYPGHQLALRGGILYPLARKVDAGSLLRRLVRIGSTENSCVGWLVILMDCPIIGVAAGVGSCVTCTTIGVGAGWFGSVTAEGCAVGWFGVGLVESVGWFGTGTAETGAVGWFEVGSTEICCVGWFGMGMAEGCAVGWLGVMGVAGPVCPCDPTDGVTGEVPVTAGEVDPTVAGWIGAVAGSADLPVVSVALEASSGVVVVGLPMPDRVCLPGPDCWSVPLACL